MPCSVKCLETRLRPLFDGVGSVQFWCLWAEVAAPPISVRCSVNSWEAQLRLLLVLLGSVDFGCLQARVMAQTISVKAQLRSLLGMLGLVQIGRCRHRPMPTLVQATHNRRLEAQLSSLSDVLVSVQFGCLQAQVTTQTTSGRGSVCSLEYQLRSLLKVVGSVQCWCLQSQVTAQSTLLGAE